MTPRVSGAKIAALDKVSGCDSIISATAGRDENLTVHESLQE